MSAFLVAGVTGRVGSAVARSLLARGDRVRAVVRDEARGRAWTEQGAELALGSLDDERFLAGALRGMDGAFVLLPENVPPEEFHAARRRMADQIVSALTSVGVPHVVLLSAVAAIAAEGSGPARDLHYFEAGLRESGLVVTTARSAQFQDNVGGVVPLAASSGIYPHLAGSADVRVPMIATRDVGALAASLLATPPVRSEIVDLLGPMYSAHDIAAALGTALGRSVRVVPVPPEERVNALVGGGLPRPIAEAVAEMFATAATGAFVPKGDRRLFGATPIDELIQEWVAHEGGRDQPAG